MYFAYLFGGIQVLFDGISRIGSHLSRAYTALKVNRVSISIAGARNDDTYSKTGLGSRHEHFGVCL